MLRASEIERMDFKTILKHENKGGRGVPWGRHKMSLISLEQQHPKEIEHKPQL